MQSLCLCEALYVLQKRFTQFHCRVEQQPQLRWGNLNVTQSTNLCHQGLRVYYLEKDPERLRLGPLTAFDETFPQHLLLPHLLHN